MSVLIKRMEMPKSCNECFAAYGGFCFVALPESDGKCKQGGRPSDCPLIKVPPHGRLIDADALHFVKGFVEDDPFDYVRRYTIERSPTIIESEGE